ncbi:hypothetical protein EIP91_007545 [Steccherinum ochraceum]|uniref:Transmembrane protein n=1 Tax=Steccherinum ochraceum TaxID=92696 RepID=A0A4V2MVD1_9APHY|nr:hypothetical protein EIP91_007545 [Steccherinum ochraceum]
MAVHDFFHIENMKFSSVGMQALSEVLSLLGITLLSHYISRRVRLVDISSWRGLKQVSFPRLLTVATFCDSWAFLFTTSILVHGLGLELNLAVCTAAVFSCIGFYATSKLFIFLYLAEKVHIVWSPTQSKSRIKSPVYILCMVMVMAYISIGLHCIWERTAYLRDDDGVCMIGLRTVGSLLLLSFDIFINVVLLLMFLYPLIRARVRSIYLRKIAWRAVIATFLMLGSSAANLSILTVLDGREVGWVCLASCGADVVVNASVLFWATCGSSLRVQPHSREGARAAAVDGSFNQNGVFVGRACMESSSSSTSTSTSSTATIHPLDDLSQSPELDSLPVLFMRTPALPVILEEDEEKEAIYEKEGEHRGMESDMSSV